MGTTKVSFRLSENAMAVIQAVSDRCYIVDRTAAIEFIIKEYQRLSKNPLRRIFRLENNDPKVKPLEAYASAE